MWIDHSTTDNEQNKVFTEELTKKGGELLECPITGEERADGSLGGWK